MKTTNYHFCINIRGMLSWPQKDLKKLLIKDDGTYATAIEAKNYLLDRLSEGKRVLPMSDCDNFCFQKGCKGHDTPSPNEEREE